MNQIRKRLTYANVMSSIAVFLILGGATAFAVSKVPKKSVGTKQLKANAVTTAKIKKNAITTQKIKGNAVTGGKVNESTLGEVPSAANAKHATSADELGGLKLAKISLFNPSSGDVGKTQLLNLSGLILVGSCSNGLEQVEASTTVANGEISSIGFDAATETISFGVQSDDFDPEETVDLIEPVTPNNDVYDINYQGGDGRPVTVQLSTEGPLNSTCGIGGHAIG